MRHDSAAEHAGIRAGDRLLSIDGFPLSDCIDVLYHLAEETAEVVLLRGNARIATTFRRKDHTEDHGLLLELPPIKECNNRCPFCFVDQAPNDKALRPGLDLRDDDYRYSFLFGHYVTLTNLREEDICRIVDKHLSPLYVSVHATDPAIRARLLGRKRGAEILPLLDHLLAEGIQFHTQVVLCPGINDGTVLVETAGALFERHPGVLTLAVVPVGLTAYHAGGVGRWTKGNAAKALDEILQLGLRFPRGFLQAADEWFSILEKDPPEAEYYADLAVEENGVGMVRRMLDEFESLTFPDMAKGKYLILTGRSPFRWIERLGRRITRRSDVSAKVVAVPNETFGKETTVTGLLGWKDVARVLHQRNDVAGYTAILPDVLLNEEKVFIDGVTLDEARAESPLPLRIVSSNAKGFLQMLSDFPH